MSAFGPTGAIAGTAAGQNLAERTQVSENRKKERAKKPERRVPEDEAVVNVESAEAVRSLKENTQEESHEDRESKAQYTLKGKAKGANKPSLDIEG